MLIQLTLRFGRKVWISFNNIVFIKPRLFFKGSKIILVNGSCVVRENPDAIVENTIKALQGAPRPKEETKK